MKFPYTVAPFILFGFLGCAADSPTKNQPYTPPPEHIPTAHPGYHPDRYNEFNRTIQTHQPGETPCNTVPDGTGGFRTICNH